jgi:hypothetical protein
MSKLILDTNEQPNLNNDALSQIIITATPFPDIMISIDSKGVRNTVYLNKKDATLMADFIKANINL